jgi:hypothetical protein
MRGLKACLWIGGILCLVSAVGVILPLSAWESMASFFGAESFPSSPLVMYFIRVMSATYVAIGIFFIILARRPMEYGIIVPFAGLASVALGLTCAIVGYIEEMPNLWFLGDASSCLVFGLLVFFFWHQAKQPAAQQTETV